MSPPPHVSTPQADPAAAFELWLAQNERPYKHDAAVSGARAAV